MKKIFLIVLIPVLFFLIALLTLKDYGMSWDEPIHFHRGQSYLYFFLTGKTTYEGLPVIREHLPKREGFEYTSDEVVVESTSEFRRSSYQSNSLPAEWFLEYDGGHPPVNDILAALTNFVFFQKLGVMGDIESHHLFNILASTLAILVVTYFAYQTYGLFTAIVVGLSFSLYPLFLAESRFNIKDPPETAFFALTIWSFWMSLKKGNWYWLLLATIGFSLALGTKFNILFLPLILVPYLFIRYLSVLHKGRRYFFLMLKKIPQYYFWVLIISPIIIIVVFFGLWPFLWQDPFGNFWQILKYYKEIGSGTGYQPGFFLPGGWNTYPAIWILFTTPPWVLILTVIGVIYVLRYWKQKESVGVLWLLWFVIPIFRITIPNTTVYGGVRQIMEYIPAMSLLSGLGAYYLIKIFGKKFDTRLISIAILLAFVPHIFILVKLHPNQNVYFNSLVGGLSGAQARNIPYWGNSFGNAYWQAVQWLNENSEVDSKVALIQGTGLNMPRVMLRRDIQYWNGYWSGINRGGEYLIELTHQDPVRVYPYAWDYVERFLDPVYEVEVDGVAIAKVWKNDLEHTEPEMQLTEVAYRKIKEDRYNNKIEVILPETVLLSRIIVNFTPDFSCGRIKGKIETLFDGQWREEPEDIPFPQINEQESVSENRMQYFFPARKAQGIRFVSASGNSCIFNNPRWQVFVLVK